MRRELRLLVNSINSTGTLHLALRCRPQLAPLYLAHPGLRLLHYAHD